MKKRLGKSSQNSHMFKKTHILEVLRDIESKLTKKNIAIYGNKYYNKVLRYDPCYSEI